MFYIYKMEKCTNCGNELYGKFCSNCGQEKVKRLEVKTIIQDVTHGIFHWENSILKTLRLLLLNPGETVRDYISGKRRYYIKPFSFFIFMQTVFVVVFHQMSEKYFAFLNVSFKGNSEIVQEQTLHIQHLVSQYVNYLNYFMPLIFGYYLYLFFRKKERINYAESLAVSFYWVGTTLVFSIILMLLAGIDIRFWNARFFVNTIFYIFAIKKFSNISLTRGIAKGLLVTLLSYLTFVVFVLSLAVSYLYFAEGINIFNVFVSSPK